MNSSAFVSLALCVAVCFVTGKYTITNQRVLQAVKLLKQKLNETNDCQDLTGTSDCSSFKKARRNMRVYMASKEGDSLTALLTEYYHKKFIGLEAVVVIDPTPEAHFGHTILLLLVYGGLSRAQCIAKKGSYYTHAEGNECMVVPATEKCFAEMKMLSTDLLKTSCSLMFLPNVRETTSLDLENKLRCLHRIEGFGPCLNVSQNTDTPCINDVKCGLQITNLHAECQRTCDYAMMVFGGWDRHTQADRHLHNIRDMWKYLSGKRFRASNMKVFFANNGSIELDNNTDTQDTFPANDRATILNSLKGVCRKNPNCVDSVVVYLNGPTFANGDILLWDGNANRIADNSGRIPVKDLLEVFKDCSANSFVIIADQNHAGHLIEEVKSGREKGIESYKRIHVITASTKDGYTYGRHFTKDFIDLDSGPKSSYSRKLVDISKELQSKLSYRFDIEYLASEIPHLTITGNREKGGCTPNNRHSTLKWETEKSKKFSRPLDSDERKIKRR